MKVETGWLSPPTAIGGLDHLGTQTPCQLIYAQLLPGITNVTDRARYYSLYPWLIRTFDRRYPSADVDTFVSRFRRADFLLTLIGDQHAKTVDEPDFLHGAAMAGRTQLIAATGELDRWGKIELDTFATRHECPTRYFKATLGGLGQYYMGTLAELGILDASSRDWVKYTHELGEPIAEAVELQVASSQFWNVVERGNVTRIELDGLSPFCPCGLTHESREHAWLASMFFADAEVFAESGAPRRQSLVMLLCLADALHASNAGTLDVGTFRGAIYSGCLPNGQIWSLPPTLCATRSAWSVYQTNEYLSIAFLSLFSTVLNVLGTLLVAGAGAPSVEALADHVANGELGDALESECAGASYGEFLRNLADDAPALGNWSDVAHEHQLCEQLLPPHSNDLPMPEQITTAFRLLALLVVRAGENEFDYAGVTMTAEELQRYPINLRTFGQRVREWRTCAVRDVLREMVTWCLVTHLSVALRKLRQTGRSTFRFRPGERGLELSDDSPVPTRTTPRFNQATQILIDLGAMRPADGGGRDSLVVTKLGRAWMARHA